MNLQGGVASGCSAPPTCAIITYPYARDLLTILRRNSSAHRYSWFPNPMAIGHSDDGKAAPPAPAVGAQTLGHVLGHFLGAEQHSRADGLLLFWSR